MADLLQRGQEQGALIAALNRRFDDLRGDLAQVRAKSDGNGQAISQVDTRVETLSGHLEAARSRVEAEEKAVAETGLRLTLVQELVKGQSERLSRSEIENGRISATAQEALDRARQAGKLAEGKLVFETTLSDEITHFGVAEASLNESAKKQLEEFAARLKVENKGVFIEIQGHTDNLGPADANLRLSRERAQAVRDYLNQVAGIPLHRLAIAAYGESKPVADNKTRDGRSRNRRVLLVVLQ
ncbi:MAG TPA: OmpA family protein, partial [Thiobacillaceae bacterium]|nr:OmpA family protein [Thiobacillaceae bacterium]